MELLDAEPFVAQVEQELSRKSRVGGFLSVCVLGVPGGRLAAGMPPAPVESWWAAIRPQVRAYDVLGRSPAGALAVLMPDTALTEAVLGGNRLLRVLRESSPETATLAAGASAAYAEVEGGAQALIDAAFAALAAAGPGEVATSRTTRGEPRLLVVDDDVVFATALSDTISERGWLGHPCNDPQDALERVRRSDYQGLFVDLVLPQASGVEILREALAHFPRRPAILMSGSDADHNAVLDALALGPVMFIRKPIAPHDLDAALRMFRVLLPGMRAR